MALWQIGFFVLPKESIESIDSFNISDDYTFDDAPYWQIRNIELTLFDEIGSFLPKSNSWAKYLTMYGEENSNRFEIISENNIVESVSFRIDFTSDYQNILCKIIEFCLHNGLIILDEKLEVLPFDFEFVNNIIKNAPQVRKYDELAK